MSKTYIGELDAYCNFGTDGVLWALYDDNRNGPSSTHFIKSGDYLKVLDNKDTVVWEGTIQFEYQRRFRNYPTNPEYGQQEVFGFWVNGFEETLAPEVWGDWFFKKFRGELTVKE